MGRPRKQREAVLVVQSLGSYGKCGECGGDVFYYSDYGVKCSNCQHLLGTWSNRRPKTQSELKEEEEMKKRVESAEQALGELYIN